MAIKIFDTDFDVKALGAITRDDVVMIQGVADADATVCTVGDLVDAMTGMTNIATGVIPMKAAGGGFEESGLVAGELLKNGGGSLYSIPFYDSSDTITSSALFAKLLTSFSSLDSSGLYPMQNVANSGNSLVGRVALGSSTRGLAIGLFNNGSTQELGIFPINAGNTSAVPQMLARQAWVQETIPTLAVDKIRVYYATSSALPSYIDDGVGLTATSNGVLVIDTDQEPPIGSLVFVKNESAPSKNGIYQVVSDGAIDAPWVLSFISEPTLVQVAGDGWGTQTGTWLQTNGYNEATYTYAKFS